MDQSHFLSGQAFQRQDPGKPGRAEIDAFYDEHGWEFIAALPRWRKRLRSAWLRLGHHQNPKADFVPEAHRG